MLRIGLTLFTCLFTLFCDNNIAKSGKKALNTTYSTTIYNFKDTSFIDSVNVINDSVFVYRFCDYLTNCINYLNIPTPIGWSHLEKDNDKYIFNGDTLIMKLSNDSSFLICFKENVIIYKIPIQFIYNQFTITVSGLFYNHNGSMIFSTNTSVMQVNEIKTILKNDFFETGCFDQDPQSICAVVQGWDTTKATYFVSKVHFNE